MATLVLQSAPPGAPAWIGQCLGSVRAWAAAWGYAYRFCGDELFDLLPPTIRARIAGSPAIASDLARLRWAQQALEEGWSRVVWLDSDVLVLDAERLALPATSHLFGAETWVQRNRQGRLRSYRNTHNALCAFTPGDPVLAFYADRAEHLVATVARLQPDQIVGPKLLTALANLVDLHTTPKVGMISPAVAAELPGGGPALDKLRSDQPEPPAAVNLCQSLAEPETAARTIEALARDNGNALC